MRHSIYWLIGLAVFMFPLSGYAQTVTVDSGGDARLINEPSGARNDNNGGNTATGALIGINPTMVDNFIVNDFSMVSSNPELMGATVSGATVTIEIMEAFSAGTEGSEDDIVILNEIALGNLGFITGTSVITANDTPAFDGSVSFNNQSETSSASSVPWVDVNGMDVDNLLGALTEIGSAPGINLPTGTPNAGLDAGGVAYVFTIDAATAQRWVDDGLAGIAMQSIDNGDGNSRFNLAPVTNGGEFVTNIAFELGTSILGDVNCDGSVDLLDVTPFVDALTDGTFIDKADINQDGEVNLLDVGPFVDLLAGG